MCFQVDENMYRQVTGEKARIRQDKEQSLTYHAHDHDPKEAMARDPSAHEDQQEQARSDGQVRHP